MRIYAGVMAVAFAIAAIGCGSGGDTTEVALTKAQFIKRGDTICRAAQKKKERAAAAWLKGNKGKTQADFSMKELNDLYSTIILPHVQDASEGLAELNPPAGDEKAAKVVQSLNKAVEAVENDPQVAIKGAPYAQADRLAQAYGFEACGLF